MNEFVIIIWVVIVFFIGLNIGFEFGKTYIMDLILKIDKLYQEKHNKLADGVEKTASRKVTKR